MLGVGDPLRPLGSPRLGHNTCRVYAWQAEPPPHAP